MKSINEFLDAVKKVTGSDNKTAILLGHDRQLISGWRRKASFPTVTQISQMCDAAGIELDRAIFAVETSREEKAGNGNYWRKKLKEFGGIAASIFFVINLIMTPTPSQDAPVLKSKGAILYIMLNDRCDNTETAIS